LAGIYAVTTTTTYIAAAGGIGAATAVTMLALPAWYSSGQHVTQIETGLVGDQDRCHPIHPVPYTFWLLDTGQLPITESISPHQAGLIEEGVAFHEQVEGGCRPAGRGNRRP